jgi:hypothetical protein
MALLLAACSVDWRLGGGKPLGLGHCRIITAKAVNEDGELRYDIQRHDENPAELPADLAKLLSEEEKQRIQTWQAIQRPVERLRYPRAVDENRQQKTRGGHTWFTRHASPMKGPTSDTTGLQTLRVGGALRDAAEADEVRAQALPPFSAESPKGDQLYGYDLFSGDSPEFRVPGNDPRQYLKLEPFDPIKYARAADVSAGPQGANRQSRQAQRASRPKNDPQ